MNNTSPSEEREQWEEHNEPFSYEPPAENPELWSSEAYTELYDRVINRREKWVCNKCSQPHNTLRKARKHVQSKHSDQLLESVLNQTNNTDSDTDNNPRHIDNNQQTLTDGGVADNTDQYDTLLRSLEQGVLLSLNNSARNVLPTDELCVEYSNDTDTDVRLSGPSDRHYKIHRHRNGNLIYSEITADGYSYEDEVTTIEILGLSG